MMDSLGTWRWGKKISVYEQKWICIRHQSAQILCNLRRIPRNVSRIYGFCNRCLTLTTIHRLFATIRDEKMVRKNPHLEKARYLPNVYVPQRKTHLDHSDVDGLASGLNMCFPWRSFQPALDARKRYSSVTMKGKILLARYSVERSMGFCACCHRDILVTRQDIFSIIFVLGRLCGCHATVLQ